MALKEFATIDVGYPILGAKFINNKTVLVTGGGGEGNNGIPNKITAVKCSFKVADPKRRLQKFREVQLPSNEDSPQCIDAVRLDDNEFDVIVGCNQSSQLIKSMSINNNVRKYTYNKNEHLTFIDAAQFEPEISGDVEEYPKIIRIAQDNSIGCLMTSRTPSVLYLFNPEYLELKYKYQPTDSSEIKDFALSPNNGEVLSLITATSIVTFSTQTNSVTFTSRSSLALNKQLGNFTLSKVKYISNYELLISASYKNGKGAVLLRYNLTSQKITQQQLISKKFNNVVGMDLSVNQDLVAVAGNDLSVTLIKLSSFKILQTFNKLHPFAITSVTFSPNGSKLATGSAANTLHVIRIPANYSSGKSIIGTLFQYLFTIVLILALGIGIQKGRDTGHLNEVIEYSKQYSQVGLQYAEVGLQYAEEYGKIFYALAQQYLGEYGVKAIEYADLAKKHGLELYTEKFVKAKEASTTTTTTTTSISGASNSGALDEINIIDRAKDTLNDIVVEVTKNLDDVTNQPGFNSEKYWNSEYVTHSIESFVSEVVDSTETPSSEPTSDSTLQNLSSAKSSAKSSTTPVANKEDSSSAGAMSLKNSETSSVPTENVATKLETGIEAVVSEIVKSDIPAEEAKVKDETLSFSVEPIVNEPLGITHSQVTHESSTDVEIEQSINLPKEQIKVESAISDQVSNAIEENTNQEESIELISSRLSHTSEASEEIKNPIESASEAGVEISLSTDDIVEQPSTTSSIPIEIQEVATEELVGESATAFDIEEPSASKEAAISYSVTPILSIAKAVLEDVPEEKEIPAPPLEATGEPIAGQQNVSLMEEVLFESSVSKTVSSSTELLSSISPESEQTIVSVQSHTASNDYETKEEKPSSQEQEQSAPSVQVASGKDDVKQLISQSSQEQSAESKTSTSSPSSFPSSFPSSPSLSSSSEIVNGTAGDDVSSALVDSVDTETNAGTPGDEPTVKPGNVESLKEPGASKTPLKNDTGAEENVSPAEEISAISNTLEESDAASLAPKSLLTSTTPSDSSTTTTAAATLNPAEKDEL